MEHIYYSISEEENSIDINIHIDADERFCRALDNLANTLLSLVIVSEERKEANDAEAEPATVSAAPATVSAPSAPVQAAPALAAVPVATAPPAPAPVPTVPTAAQTYTQDQLALAASGLVDAGRMTELQQLLASFNVQALTQLPKEHYGAFATKLREMGAKI